MTEEEIIVKIKLDLPLTKEEERYYFVNMMGGDPDQFERMWAITHNEDPATFID